MRCILVNDANLKADTCCSYCRKQIGNSYIRELGARFLYCDYTCFRSATAIVAIPSGYPLPLSAWTISS